MQDDAADVVKKVIEAAKGGDMAAARIVLDRLFPARRDNVVIFSLPKIESADDAAKAMAGIASAVASGQLSPCEAEQVTRIVEGFIKTLEVTELEARIAALEKSREQSR